MALKLKLKSESSAAAATTEIRHSPSGISAAPETKVAPEVLEMEAAIQAVGFILTNNLKSYWLSASDRRQTLTEGFSVVSTVLNRNERLRITVEGDDLKVNGEPYEKKTMHLNEMVKHLGEVGPCSFAMEKGMDSDEFQTFMDLISKPTHELAALGDFTDAVNNRNFPHITSKRIILREVAEDEAVISKKDLEAASEEERQKVESDVLSLLNAQTREADAAKAQEQAGSLRRVVTDSDKMARLIMQAAEGKQADLADRQKVAQVVVECLDKAFDALIDDPFSKTQKGKKAIAAALQKLEESLLSKISLGSSVDEHPVTSAVERMTERLKMDSIVQDYTKKLQALEDSEKKILRFMKLQGLDRVKDSDLSKKLGEEGVDVSDWHRLLALSGAKAATDLDADDEAAAAVAQLATILKRLETDVSDVKDKGAAAVNEKVAKDLQAVNAGVRVLTAKTQEKIAGLVESVQADQAAANLLEQEAARIGKPLKMSRQRMITVLAEVVQEICQPLSVIACSVDMLTSKTLGELSQAQMDMLNLVGESSARIQALAGSLEKIAGNPDTLSPDAAIQKALYEQ
jgi:hypothetical protein